MENNNSISLKGICMEFAKELLRDILPELKTIVQDHYLEIATYQDIPLDPDYDRYLFIEETGTLRIFTIREDKELVGYCVLFVHPSLQFKSSVQAVQDLLFLKQDLRKQGIGAQFLNWIDSQLKAEGIQVVYQHTKAGKSFASLLESLGYKLVDQVYARRLDKCVDQTSPM